MPNAYQRRYTLLQDELAELQRTIEDPVLRADQCRKASHVALKDLRDLLISYPPTSTTEEICFFKKIKPLFYIPSLYHERVYFIELRMPVGGLESKISYLNTEANKLSLFLDTYQTFYDYYRSQSVRKDADYFTRGRLWLDEEIPSLFLQLDDQFSTGYDLILSQIQANDLLEEFIANRAYALAHPGERQTLKTGRKYEWTASLIDFAEMLYGLKSDGAINHGRLSAKGLAADLGQFFGVKVDYISKKFEEIRMRKKNRTTFWDRGKRSLIRKMEEDDEHAL